RAAAGERAARAAGGVGVGGATVAPPPRGGARQAPARPPHRPKKGANAPIAWPRSRISLWLIIDQSVPARRYACPAIQRAQLTRVADLVNRERLTVQMIPTSSFTSRAAAWVGV